jgi:hypothetical protein
MALEQRIKPPSFDHNAVCLHSSIDVYERPPLIVKLVDVDIMLNY